MLVWNSIQASSTAERSAEFALPSAASMLGRNLFATDLSASAGHTLNQSMVVQLTRDGNLQSEVLHYVISVTQHRLERHANSLDSAAVDWRPKAAVSGLPLRT